MFCTFLRKCRQRDPPGVASLRFLSNDLKMKYFLAFKLLLRKMNRVCKAIRTSAKIVGAKLWKKRFIQMANGCGGGYTSAQSVLCTIFAKYNPGRSALFVYSTETTLIVSSKRVSYLHTLSPKRLEAVFSVRVCLLNEKLVVILYPLTTQSPLPGLHCIGLP